MNQFKSNIIAENMNLFKLNRIKDLSCHFVDNIVWFESFINTGKLAKKIYRINQEMRNEV